MLTIRILFVSTLIVVFYRLPYAVLGGVLTARGSDSIGTSYIYQPCGRTESCDRINTRLSKRPNRAMKIMTKTGI